MRYTQDSGVRRVGDSDEYKVVVSVYLAPVERDLWGAGKARLALDTGPVSGGMRRTNLRGHALRAEGKAYVPGDEELWVRAGRTVDLGRGLCECGAVSDWHVSDAARKRWHAEHADEIRAAPVLGQGGTG